MSDLTNTEIKTFSNRLNRPSSHRPTPCMVVDYNISVGVLLDLLGGEGGYLTEGRIYWMWVFGKYFPDDSSIFLDSVYLYNQS